MEGSKSVRIVRADWVSEQDVRTSVEQRVVVKLTSPKDVKHAEILRRLTAQFAEKTLLSTQVYDWNKTNFRLSRVSAK